jgi:O-methyltransferase
MRGRQIDYYEALMGSPGLLAPRGVVAVDNTLWYSRVLRPEAADESAETRGVRAFSRHVRADPRTLVTMVPMRDGLTLIQRLR